VDWSEWNGRFRDTVRRFEKAMPASSRNLGWRLTGSACLKRFFNPAGKNRDRVETMNPLNGFTVGGDVDSRR
jgi:pullulanase/glycogen debranching enzyme